MFWELHRNDRERDMTELSQLLTAFFSYAAEQDGTVLDQSSFSRAFPQSAAWFFRQLQGRQKNRKAFRRAVEELFRLPAARRRAIAQAVAHDMDFDRAADPSCFFFAVPALPEKERALVSDFFRYFYEVVFPRKRGPTINGGISGATRSGFSDAYYRANGSLLNACPVCLHHKSDAARENDLEHYFPKGVYPALILHPSNLFFLCKDCNETYKRAADVLRAGKEPLSKVFLPYRDTVRDHAKIVFRRKANTDCVKLLAADGTGEEQERVDHFNALYRLEERWSADIAGIFERFRKRCVERAWSREEARRNLKELCQTFQDLSEFPDELLASAYLNWLCETVFDAFYDSLRQDGDGEADPLAGGAEREI